MEVDTDSVLVTVCSVVSEPVAVTSDDFVGSVLVRDFERTEEDIVAVAVLLG